MGNKIQFFKKNILTLYFATEFFLSYNINFINIKIPYRPDVDRKLFMFGLKAEIGFLLRIFHYNDVPYHFKIFTKINDSPLVINTNTGTLEKKQFIFNYFGFGIEIRQ